MNNLVVKYNVLEISTTENTDGVAPFTNMV